MLSITTLDFLRMFSARVGRAANFGLFGAAMLFGLLFIGLLPVAHANAGLISCTATLDGANEVPPNTSAATGSATFTFDPVTAASTWSVSFAGLTAPATAAHVHAPASPGSNAAVVVPLTTIPSATSGSYSGSGTTSFPTVSEPSASSFASDLLAGKAYVNIHDSIFPSGEIRGWLGCSQAAGVPEFSTAFGALAVAAMLVPVLTALRRPRK